MKHVLVTLQWEVLPDGTRYWVLDPLWVFIRQLAHNGQASDQILPTPNGFTEELWVDDATAADMETNPLCVLIWQEAV